MTAPTTSAPADATETPVAGRPAGRPHHGAESYFIVGEGLLTESGEGRPAARLLEVTAAAPPFRFSRMGPRGRQLGDANRRKLAKAMVAAPGPASDVPAGYTYLGQFIDHDLTFDVTTVMLGRDITPARLLQGRSPSLDLDSLYGAGPGDPGSAGLYSDGMRLKVGATEAEGPPGSAEGKVHQGMDLPRLGTGATTAERRRANIADPRNDENLAVAQTHAALIRFHNRMVDRLAAAGTPAPQLFAAAREAVTKHYQWMIRHDYLPRIVDPGIVNNVFKNGRKAFEVGADPMSVPTMPVEFSVGAFRLGHSMVRGAYNWNRIFDAGSGTLEFLFAFTALSGNLAPDGDQTDPDGGAERLPSTWIADWRRLYDFTEAGRADLGVPVQRSNRARRIDTLLVDPLAHLPPASFGGPQVGFDDPRRNLAFRNLTRARMVRLATGQGMAASLRDRGIAVTPLSEAKLRNGRDGARLDGLTPTQRAALLRDTPLWFYALREAELNDGRLTGVGGRIVAETFHRAMEGSTHSIVRDTAFRPSLGPDAETFRMTELLLFAFEGKKALLAPLG